MKRIPASLYEDLYEVPLHLHEYYIQGRMMHEFEHEIALAFAYDMDKDD
jgi:hypothetical protein